MKHTTHRIFAAAIATLTLALTLASAGQAQAAPALIVNDAGDDCGKLVAGYTSIQEAVDAARAMNRAYTILVCPGTYAQFEVDGAQKLTIRAANSKLPLPVVTPTGGSYGSVVLIRNSKSVVIDHLIVDGSGFDDFLTGYTFGIYITDSTVKIQNSVVTSMGSVPADWYSPGHGIVIFDTDPADAMKTNVVITNNRIVDVVRDRIAIQGPARATITKNLIESPAVLNPAPDAGISFIGNAAGSPTGTVSKNTISHAASGVGMFNASGVSVKSNTITDVKYGVFIYTSCAGGATSSNNVITRNDILAVYSAAIELHGDGCATHADGNIFSKNIFRQDRNVSSYRAAYIYPEGPLDIASKNAFIGNSVYGYTTVVSSPMPETTIVSKNKLLPLP